MELRLLHLVTLFPLYTYGATIATSSHTAPSIYHVAMIATSSHTAHSINHVAMIATSSQITPSTYQWSIDCYI